MISDGVLLLEPEAYTSSAADGIEKYERTGLTAIEVKGEDAAKFLQGQLTCDVYGVTATQARLAAYCNAKGRAISTLLLVRCREGFLLILPDSLCETVLKTLRKYIMRAQVTLDVASELRVWGLHLPSVADAGLNLPAEDFQVGLTPIMAVKLPHACRYLVLENQQNLSEFFQSPNLHNCTSGSVEQWRFQDITSGLPWFELDQSEQHVPQMLNLDQWGAISFNKGCYTGQEVIARSHYLGKVKRAMFVAESKAITTKISSGCGVLESGGQHSLGRVLASAAWSGSTRLLLVLQIVDDLPKHLILDDDYRSPISIISDQ